jgi:hypothetical protein
MLDIHAVTSGGGTAITAISTIAAGGDNASAAGVPLASGATLVTWGGLTTIADTIKELKLVSQDLIDSVNGEDYTTGGAASGILSIYDNLPFYTGARNISMAQNTAGANNIGFTIDQYSSAGQSNITQEPLYGGLPNRNAMYSQVFGAALTAITWGSQKFAPTNAIPAGKYSIKGAWVSSLTNYALIRFQHADFGPFTPGFPVADPNAAIARAVAPGSDLLFSYPGYQFAWLSIILGVPAEPVFTVQAGGTGLNIQCLDITADTPQVFLNLTKVA